MSTHPKKEWFDDDSFWIDQYSVMCFDFDVTPYSGQELRDRLESVGFTDVTLYGNLTGGEYGFNAERLIATARKPERDPGSQAAPNHDTQPTADGGG